MINRLEAHAAYGSLPSGGGRSRSIFLLAGIDSNLVAALTVETGAKVLTVTLAFEEYAGTPNDEAPLAETAAKNIGTEHATVRVFIRSMPAKHRRASQLSDQPGGSGAGS